MKVCRSFFLFFCLCLTPARGQEVAAFVEITPGTLPVILLAPHGGSLKPEGVAERRFGKFVTDANTADLTRRMAAALEETYGARPITLLCLMHRSRVDCNRELEEAAQGDRRGHGGVGALSWRGCGGVQTRDPDAWCGLGDRHPRAPP